MKKAENLKKNMKFSKKERKIEKQKVQKWEKTIRKGKVVKRNEKGVKQIKENKQKSCFLILSFF